MICWLWVISVSWTNRVKPLMSGMKSRVGWTGHPYWTITLQPETAFLWTDYETCQALGFENEDAGNETITRDLLAEQSRLLGIEQ